MPCPFKSRGLATTMRTSQPFGVLFLAMILLPLIAAASPPDSTWIPGVYDASDLDDVVTLVVEMSASKSGTGYQPSPPLCSWEDLFRPDQEAYGRRSGGLNTRGPPQGSWQPPIVARQSRVDTPRQFCGSCESTASVEPPSSERP